MRLRSANERLLTDVCVPLPASRIVVQFLCRPAKSAGLAAYPKPLSAIMRVVVRQIPDRSIFTGVRKVTIVAVVETVGFLRLR